MRLIRSDAARSGSNESQSFVFLFDGDVFIASFTKLLTVHQ